ncbi:hypothetical protein SeLEV6574_g00050 [Synchytrium endobioticum]|uniref:Uncharacterized protein n=1 Tax=Synchytrium endobioticum TaxID=286115 RepID=A0A507DK71_9FUNG|nr:hypothetical protein SeLEV6574_g00050 [Synchytrium endobioticum]
MYSRGSIYDHECIQAAHMSGSTGPPAPTINEHNAAAAAHLCSRHRAYHHATTPAAYAVLPEQDSYTGIAITSAMY